MDKYSLKEIWRNRKVRDYLHYLMVYALVLLSWWAGMTFWWHSDIFPTALMTFVVFVIGDKLAHKIFKLDKKVK